MSENFQILTAMRRKWVTIPPIFRVSQKEPGIRRLYLIQDDPENFSKKYSRRKKLSRWHATGVVSITDFYYLGKVYGPILKLKVLTKIFGALV